MLTTMICSKLYEFIKKCSNKMGCESTKCYSTAVYTTIMVVLSLQLLGTIEKQVFDFLGYMWAPIIGNFFQIICTILGIFGTYQYRPKFIAVYTTWSLVWLGWNIFVICLYLEVGVLNRNREIYILNIGTRNKSWWLDHGIGCKVSNDTWLNDVPKNAARVIPPEEFVEGCLLDYYYVEVIHAGVQCLLALTGFVFTCLAIYIYGEEPESTSPANDELEFVKMHNLTQARNNNEEIIPDHTSITMETDAQSTRSRATTEYATHNEFPTIDRPPSYETSMRNATAVNPRYGADRQSVRSARSARSNRSKASTRSKKRERAQQQQNLPWVQITPSSSNMTTDSAPYRHFP